MADKYIQEIKSDRVPEELWTEGHNFVDEVVIKAILEKRKAKGLNDGLRSILKNE